MSFIEFHSRLFSSCVSTKQCDDSLTSLAEDLQPLERPLPYPVSLPTWDIFNTSTLFGERLTEIEFEDSEFAFESTSNMSYFWNYVVELVALVADVSEAQLLKPVEVESGIYLMSAIMLHCRDPIEELTNSGETKDQ